MMHIFYLGNPNTDGVFNIDLQRDEFCDGISIFLFELSKADKSKANFSVVDEPGVCQRISKERGACVESVCDSDTYPPKKIEHVNTITSGEARLLASGHWKMATKAKIEYVGTNVQESSQISYYENVLTTRSDEKKLDSAVQEDRVCQDSLEFETIDKDKQYELLPTEDDSDVGKNRESVKPSAEDVKDLTRVVEDEKRYLDSDIPEETDAEEIDYPLTDKRQWKMKGLCPYCFSKYKIKIGQEHKCDSGNRELPYTHRDGKSKDLYFAIFGGENVGKSHYIAVLINNIKRRLTKTFKVNLQSLDDHTWRRYAKEYYNPIFKKNKIIAAKHSVRVNEPLLYSLSFMKPRLLGKERIADVNTLAFFDNNVESFKEWETINTNKKHKKDFVHGIILLIDPLQLTETRKLLNFPAISGTPPEDVVNSVAKLIRREAQKRYGDPNEKIDIPIAIVLSKIDMLEDKLGEDKKFLFSNCEQDGYFNQTDAKNVNDEIEKLMGDLVGTVTRNFSNAKFFGVSALGFEPDGFDIPKLRPIRVEDPFLWLLCEKKVIKGKKI